MWLLFILISIFTLSLRVALVNPEGRHKGAAWFAWIVVIGITIYTLVLHQVDPVDAIGRLSMSIFVGYFVQEIFTMIFILYRKLIRVTLCIIGIGAMYGAYRLDSEVLAFIALIYLCLINIMFYMKDKGENMFATHITRPKF